MILLLYSCDKQGNDATGIVEFFLLEAYETVGEGCEIEQGSAKLETAPLIRYADLLQYDAGETTFTISPDAKETIDSMEHSVFGVPFGVTAGGELIYTGYFWPAYSSLGCQWIIIDPLFFRGENKLVVELGYPGQIDGVAIPDHRNDPRILEIFRRDGKLVE